MQTTQVTQKQWKVVIGENTSRFEGDDLPVENVSWDDARIFIQKLNKRLYNMHGNVWKWYEDRYGEYPLNYATDPMGQSKSSTRVLRGGGRGSTVWVYRSAIRKGSNPGIRFNFRGFRLAGLPGQRAK